MAVGRRSITWVYQHLQWPGSKMVRLWKGFVFVGCQNRNKTFRYIRHTYFWYYLVVVNQVSKNRFWVRSWYHKLGFGLDTGITLLFEPRYRVSSSNIRVSETLENLSKMINLFYFCEQVFEKSSKLPAIFFLIKQKHLKQNLWKFFLKK